jgi:hypothetical protein
VFGTSNNAKAPPRRTEVGEPRLTRFDADNLAPKLWAMGFSRVIHLTPEDAHERISGIDAMGSSRGAASGRPTPAIIG